MNDQAKPSAPESREVEIISVPVKAGDQLPDIQRMPRPEELVALIDKRNEFLLKSLPLVVTTTKAQDWVDMGGKPYPTTGAALKIMNRFGISTVNNSLKKIESDDEKGRYYIYIYEADYILPGFHTFHSIGTCTSRDQFFAVRKDEKGEKEFKPLYEVSEDNIIKAAKSNCDVNGMRGLLGLKSVTWDELEQCGLKRGESARVNYKKGGAGKSTSNPPTQAKPASSAPTKPTEKPADKAPEKPTEKPVEKESAPLNRDELIGEWNMICEFLQTTKGIDPDNTCEQFFPFREPNKDGATYASLDMIQRFKTDGALGWLRGGIEKIKKTFDVGEFERFKAAGGVQE